MVTDMLRQEPRSKVDDDLDFIVKALGRAKKEADELPMGLSSEGRENIRFLFWMLGGVCSLIGTIVVATTVVVGYRNDVRDNRQKIDLLETRTNVLTVYDFREVGRLTFDMSTQREYGVSNKEWYLAKHGFAPATNALAQPYATPAPPAYPAPCPTPSK